MHRKTLLLVPLLLSLTAAGCLGTRPQPPVPAPPSAPIVSKPVETQGATVYQLNPKASKVDILVYRGGTLARLGHNHVMTSRSVTGRVWLHSDLEKSGFEMAFPVGELVVDDADARRAAGPEFPPDIPQGDKDGTRKNMLRAEVLNGEQFPEVKLQAVSVSGTREAPQIMTRITIKDASRDIEVPATVKIDDNRITASGELDIQQTTFGMKPFSVAMGAIAVKDQLHIKFELVAERG